MLMVALKFVEVDRVFVVLEIYKLGLLVVILLYIFFSLVIFTGSVMPKMLAQTLCLFK